MRSAVFILVFVTALLLLSGGVESKRKKREKKSLFKDRSKKKSGKGSPGDEPDVEEIKFESEEEKQEILQKLQRERQAKEKMGDEPPSSKEMVKLKMQERELRRELGEAVMKYGDDSKEKATVLHKVGYNLFKQVRFEDLWDISLEIVRIHELHDGPESVETGKALSNCAQTAFRIGKRDECGLASYRYLYIMIKHMGLQSKEVVMARARLMQYHFRDGETSKGMSYAEYLATKGIATDEDAGDEFDEDHIEL